MNPEEHFEPVSINVEILKNLTLGEVNQVFNYPFILVPSNPSYTDDDEVKNDWKVFEESKTHWGQF